MTSTVRQPVVRGQFQTSGACPRLLDAVPRLVVAGLNRQFFDGKFQNLLVVQQMDNVGPPSLPLGEKACLAC